MMEHWDKLTSHCKWVLNEAVKEAEAQSHNFVGTGHILAALTRDGSGTASKILARHGVQIWRVRRELEEMKGGLEVGTVHPLAENQYVGDVDLSQKQRPYVAGHNLGAALGETGHILYLLDNRQQFLRGLVDKLTEELQKVEEDLQKRREGKW